MSTLALVNPKAREGALAERFPALKRELFDALGESEAAVRVAFTTPEDHGAGIVRRALLEGVRRVVVIGGDGTLSEALQGFFDCTAGAPRAIAPEAELAVLPTGRGNDFFKSMVGERLLSSDEVWRRGLALVRSWRARPTDVGSVSFPGAQANRVWINVTSFGMPGLIVQRVLSRAGFWGRSRVGKGAWTYLFQSGAALLQYKPMRVEVLLDGREFYSGPVLNGFVLNGHYNAGGADWASGASLDDGKFNVMIVEPQTPLQSAACLPRMLSGRWEGAPRVHLGTGARVEISLVDSGPKPHPIFEIDGDQPEPTEGRVGNFEVLAGAVRIVR